MLVKDETMEAERYTNDSHPVVLKSNNKMFGNNWTYQKNDLRTRTHHLSQKYCADYFPAIISKIRCHQIRPIDVH
jgi:hypothetical protein